jgi:hypothetical protein
MNLNLNDLLSVLGLNEKKHSRIETLLFEYGTLTQKLQNVEAQSFYFMNGLENHKLRSLELKKEWEIIASDINTVSLDELIFSLNDMNNQLAILNAKKKPRTVDFIHRASVRSKIAYIEELLSIKERVKEVFEIDYYLKNNEEMKNILGI